MANRDHLYLKGIAKGHFSKNYFVDGKLGFQTIPHGIIIPHLKISEGIADYWGICGVVDNHGNFRKEITNMQDVETLMSLNEKIKASSGEVVSLRRSPKTVIYLGLFAPAWGHDITLNLRRFWFLNTETFKKEFKNCQLVYTPWHKKGWGEDYQTLAQKPNFPRILETLGIDPAALKPIMQPTQFANVIVPEDSFYFLEDKSLRFTEEYRTTVNQIREFALRNKKPVASKKIYFFYGRHQNGEERMASYFRSKGYRMFLPEKLTFDEQLNLMVNAESFASTLGSCSHNSLFMREGTKAIFIPRGPFMFTGYQELLNQVNFLDAYYVDSSLSIFGELHESYCFIISKQLKDFFGDKFFGYTKGDFENFLAYVKNALNSGYKFNEKALPYYAPVYKFFLNRLRQQKDLIRAYGLQDKFQPGQLLKG